MKAFYIGLGLAVCLLIVKGHNLPIKYQVEYYFMAKCTNAKEEDFKVFEGFLEKCDKEFVKLEEIIRDFKDDKKDTIKLFCKFYPEFHNCTEGALNFLKKCMNSKERNIVDIFGMLQQFMCSKNEKQGTVFVAEGGINCFNTTIDNIEDCVIKSAGHFTKTDQPICSDLGEIRKCVRTNMETCSSKIPANILEDFFKTIKEKLQCKN